MTHNVRTNEITVSGHARYDEHGKDIVCVAVSVLVNTLVESMEEVTQGKLDCIQRDGFTQIVYWPWFDDGVQVLIRAFFIGVGGIAEAYPG
ncbi:ribosomal-processing cysteine protease Prp [Eubacterium aggregans]|uniref:ribosomal-processing cysteine protease Prp n=1 Tax=Eubacterium aggregans TaxID=81409 RepID=UPI003F31D014